MGLEWGSVADVSKWTGDGMEFGFGAEDKGEIGADALDRGVDRWGMCFIKEWIERNDVSSNG